MSENLEVYSCNICKQLQLQRFKESLNKYYGDCFVLKDKKILKHRNLRIKKKYSRKFFFEKKIIEIGGGKNSMLPYFKSKEKWLCDFDIDRKENSTADKIVSSDFIKAKIPNNYFDVVLMFQTLEHIENISDFIKKISSILKKNGLVFVEVPNLNCCTKNNPNYAFFFQHQTIFERKSLMNFFFRNGFSLDTEIIKRKQNDLFHSYKNIKSSQLENIYSDKIKQVFNLLNKRVCKAKSIINKNKGKKIAIYGVGGVCITLLYHLGSEIKFIKYYYDNDHRKHKRYIPSTNIVVKSKDDIKLDNPKLILFTNANVMKEFKKESKIEKCVLI